VSGRRRNEKNGEKKGSREKGKRDGTNLDIGVETISDHESFGEVEMSPGRREKREEREAVGKRRSGRAEVERGKERLLTLRRCSPSWSSIEDNEID